MVRPQTLAERVREKVEFFCRVSGETAPHLPFPITSLSSTGSGAVELMRFSHEGWVLVMAGVGAEMHCHPSDVHSVTRAYYSKLPNGS